MLEGWYVNAKDGVDQLANRHAQGIDVSRRVADPDEDTGEEGGGGHAIRMMLCEQVAAHDASR